MLTVVLSCAIYARKSNEQRGVDEEQKSVSRQIEHARQYARRKGWIVDEESIFVDDGISGAEFSARPGFVRMMNALKPRPRFQVVIMSEESRLGRESIETAYALKEIVRAGVRVFYYLDDRERTLASPTDKMLLAMSGIADEFERVRASQRTKDKLADKFRSGYATGKLAFGYRRVEVLNATGDKRSHTLAEIDPEAAAIVRRIFTRANQGAGVWRIANELKREEIPTGRTTRFGWTAPTVRYILQNPIYRGEVEYGKRVYKDPFGTKVRHVITRNEQEIARRIDASLRIVSDAEWFGAQKALARVAAAAAITAKPRSGAQLRDGDSKYLLSNFARCSVCDGPLGTASRPVKGGRREYFYRCYRYQRYGKKVCTNGVSVPIAALDAAVLEAVREAIFPKSDLDVGECVDRMMAEVKAITASRTSTKTRATLAKLELERDRLVEAIISGGKIAALVTALKDRETKIAEMRATVAALDASRVTKTGGPTPDSVARKVFGMFLTRFSAIFRGGRVDELRSMFREILDGPIRMTGTRPAARPGAQRPSKGAFTFEGQLRGDVRTFAGLAGLSPSESYAAVTVKGWTRKFSGKVAA